jgi:hypothetical protein
LAIPILTIALTQYMDAPALVVLAYNRPQYLRTTLESLTQVPGISRFKLYVSQDGNDKDVAHVIGDYPLFSHLTKERATLDAPLSPTAYIAQHYKCVRFRHTGLGGTAAHTTRVGRLQVRVRQSLWRAFAFPCDRRGRRYDLFSRLRNLL